MTNKFEEEKILRKKFIGFFDVERVISGECSPEDIYAEREEDKKLKEQFPEFDIRKHPEAYRIYSDEYLRNYVQKHCRSVQKIRDAIEEVKKEIPDKAKADIDKYFGRGILSAVLKKLNLVEK